MRKIIHVCLSVRGALSNESTIRELTGNITVDGRTLDTKREIREFLFDQLAMGHEVLPCGECEGFDWKTGCPGHEVTEPVTEDNECSCSQGNQANESASATTS